MLASVLGDTWRLIVSVAILVAIAAFWYRIVSRLTPFGGGTMDPALEAAREAKYERLRRVTVRLDVMFFIWLVVEGAIVVPWMMIKYGLQ
jgi:hypothetical protein